MSRILSLALLALAVAGCDSVTETASFASSTTSDAQGNSSGQAATVGCNSDVSVTVARNEAGVLVAYTGPTGSSNCVYNSQNALAQFTVLLHEELTPDMTERLTSPEDYPFCTAVDPRTGEMLTTERSSIINRPNGQSKVVCHF